MKHILFVDSLTKLNFKKDSSLLLASTLKKQGHEVYLLFEENFYINNKISPEYLLHPFEFSFYEENFYLKKFELKNPIKLKIVPNDIIHMRIDPPFDTRYLRYLWMLKFLKDQGIKVLNSPEGILKYNEKLFAYTSKSSLPSFVGSSNSGFLSFLEDVKKDKVIDLIFKPLDLFQGIGVTKVSITDPEVLDKFIEMVELYKGAIVVQPFYKEVENGEIRAIFYKGKELGSILKIPKKGEFLANIAQGASFTPITLSENLKNECTSICNFLREDGVDWVAFDILGEHISEINITCPGLLVEVSNAHNENLALRIC